ncbi:MAG: hypothetical protein DRR19_04380 [Candidatus Parabeggiatoa sp. nov. 1]|nr:MAG: hypothetical protein DRR19_04380 [Gammaproteobacteria bacterium]
MKANDMGTDFKQQMLELENRFKEWYFSQKSIPNRLAGFGRSPIDAILVWERQDKSWTPVKLQAFESNYNIQPILP